MFFVLKQLFFHVSTADETGAAFPDVLVMVRSLEGNGESFRALTDQAGAVPKQELAPGLYQLIATCPYGLCQTAVREFIVASDPIHSKLPLKVVAMVNTVIVGDVKHRQVEVQDREGRPLASAQILVRDETAQHHKWYRTGANGTVTIDLPPGDEITVVAIYQGSLASSVVQPHAKKSRKKLVLIRF
jgi:uncharacterized surface anchored protein